MKHTWRVALASAALLGLTVPASGQDRCEERDVRELELAAAGIERLDLEAHAGSLVVEGREGLSRVEVHAVLCASDRERLDALDVRLERTGSRAVLETRFPDWNDSGWGRNRYARIDLVVQIPRGLAADITDGSGEIEIRGTGPLTLRDGSGSLTIRDIVGGARIDDGSGEIEISGVQGDVEVEDGSGGITIEEVSGGVHLRDGSGQVEIRGVERDVEVSDKGSGQIEVQDVRGDLRVQGTRRERIRYANVAGEVDLPPARRGRGG
ncbi:MAG: hypothetical protein R3E10_12575 [Gemmatimonadota bacterium]